MIIKKFFVLISLILFVAIFCIQNVFAHNANCSSYYVNMFGTGMATADVSSTNYNAEFISTSQAGTRNAESDSYTVNIGVFENTTYYVTVSITSYSISPTSAVVGSTISLYISALNTQSVWATITSPNSQEQIVTLVNNQFITYSPPSIVGTYTVTFYANSSTGAIASVVSSFELTAQSTTPPSSGGGGGGGSTTRIIEKCTYLWDCTPWGVCADGKQKRICTNTGTCNGTESKPIEEMPCSNALFDIALELEDIELTENKTLKFNIDLKEKIGVEKIDVYVKYSIINKDDYEIFSQIETKAIEKSLFYEKEIEEIKLVNGEYILRVDILYGYQQRAFAEQKIKISDGEIEKEKTKTGFLNFIINRFNVVGGFLFIILIGILVIVQVSYHGEKRKRKVKHTIKNKIRGIFIVVLIGVIALGFGLVNGFTITSKTIFSFVLKSGNLISLFIFIFIIFFALLILKYGKRARKCFKKKSSENSLKVLINKKVYTVEGDYLGKVKDIILDRNKIDSLKIKLNKRKVKAKGVIINYRDVKNVGQIVIVDDGVLGNLGG